MADNSSIKHNNYTYQIVLDPIKDAWNWYDACNDSIQHGVDWSKDVPNEVLLEIKGKSETEAYEFIAKFLKQKYIDDSGQINDFVKYINERYSENFEISCQLLEKAMGRPIYRKSFTIYITTYPMAPYNYDDGSIFDYIGWTDTIVGLLHELSHMQFTHYWRNNPDSAVSKLNDSEFEWLKESLTVIFDEEFLPFIEKIDKGYEIHKSFREALHKNWKSNHNFDKLVDFGIKILPNYYEAESK